MTITYEQVRSNAKIRTYIKKQDENLISLGYTEHSFNHVCRVAHTTGIILKTLGYPDHEVELGQIAGYLHDIGNVINRIDHAQSGAVMAFRLLEELGADPEDVALIISAIGNHDEGTGYPVNEIAAALILADKSDVRRSRVRTRDSAYFDIHDRVNYAVETASCQITEDHQIFQLQLQIDTTISAVMDYFEIFLGRMLFCRKAAEKLGLKFQLVINDQIVL
ncbi:MAG: HD domain-containing protein [Angelakisella sp.]